MKGKTAQKKRKRQVVESTPEENSTSSAKESGSTGAPISGSGAANVVAGCADDSDVVDLSGLRDEALVARIIKKAPVDLASVGLLITKAAEEVGKLVSSTQNLEEELMEVSGQINILIIENSCIRPQQLVSALPIQLEGAVLLKQELPCVLCGRFWADMAMANLPCGCLLHPSCMFKACLSKEPKCPNCAHVPSAVWMGQWGFRTNSESMQASIAAHNAATGIVGSEKPLNPKKMEEVHDFLTADNINQHSTFKRSALGVGTDLHVDSQKRICIGLDPLQLSVATNPVVDLPSSIVALSSSASPDAIADMADVTEIAKAAAMEVAGNEQ